MTAYSSIGGKGMFETALERSVRIVYNWDTFGVWRGDQVADWAEGQAVMDTGWDCDGEPLYQEGHKGLPERSK